MKKIIIALCLLSSPATFAQKKIVDFRVSKPYCLLNFIETAAGQQGGHSSTLRKYIKEQIPATDTAFKRVLTDFGKLILNYQYNRDEFPASRRSHRSTYDLICIAAAQTNTLTEFQNRIAGILPNSEQQKLLHALSEAENYYDRIIWNANQEKMQEQAKSLGKYNERTADLFYAFKRFYNSSWAEDMPFTVTLYPIPGRNGNTTATPYANSLCVGVLTEEKDHVTRLGVVLHEMCHVLYDEQPAGFQHQLDSFFRKNPSPFSAPAANFFDEALATALGNGYVYQYMHHRPDTTAWYDNPYIDGFAHAIYPVVEHYLAQKKSIDQAFVDRAIQLFQQTFPDAVTDYNILLNNVSIYADMETAEERNRLIDIMGSYYQLSHFGLSAPVANEQSLQYLRENTATQLVIIDGKQAESIDALKKLFPAMVSWLDKKENYVLSFFDTAKRPVIIIRAENTAMLDKAMRLTQRQKNMDDNSPYKPVM